MDEKEGIAELVNAYTLITGKSYLCRTMEDNRILGDFYRILETDRGSSERLSVKISLNPGHPIYKGHFPNLPIAPGVCLIQIIKEVLVHSTGQDLHLTEGNNIRFMAVVNPNLTPCVCIDYELPASDSETTEVSALIRWEEVTYLKFKGKFKKAV